MTDPVDPLSEQLALHEAGHAVAAVVLSFTVSGVRFEELSRDEWVGETNSTAVGVQPSDPDPDRRESAAVVALAGRAGRRYKYPEWDTAWLPFEHDDQLRARRVLGLSTTAEASALDTIAARAEQIILVYRAAVQEVANAILRAGFENGLSGEVIHALVKGHSGDEAS